MNVSNYLLILKKSSDKSENENFKVTLDIKNKDKSQNNDDIKAKSTEESILKRIKKNDSTKNIVFKKYKIGKSKKKLKVFC